MTSITVIFASAAGEVNAVEAGKKVSCIKKIRYKSRQQNVTPRQ